MSETSMSRRLEHIRDLTEVFSTTNLLEMEVQAVEFSLKLKRAALRAGSTGESGAIANASFPAVSSEVNTPEAAVASTKDDASLKAVKTVKSGMSGNFFRASAPGEAPFVKTGDRVEVGQKLCLIEAMKMLNEVDSDWAGTVKEVLAEEGGAVSVGTPLFVIEVNDDV